MVKLMPACAMRSSDSRSTAVSAATYLRVNGQSGLQNPQFPSGSVWPYRGYLPEAESYGYRLAPVRSRALKSASVSVYRRRGSRDMSLAHVLRSRTEG